MMWDHLPVRNLIHLQRMVEFDNSNDLIRWLIAGQPWHRRLRIRLRLMMGRYGQ